MKKLLFLLLVFPALVQAQTFSLKVGAAGFVTVNNENYSRALVWTYWSYGSDTTVQIYLPNFGYVGGFNKTHFTDGDNSNAAFASAYALKVWTDAHLEPISPGGSSLDTGTSYHWVNQSFENDTITNTRQTAILLKNATITTTANPIPNSPALEFLHHKWKTGSGASDKIVGWKIFDSGLAGNQIASNLHFLFNNNGTFSSMANLSSAGALTLAGSLTATSGNFGAGSVTCGSLSCSSLSGVSAMTLTDLTATHIKGQGSAPSIVAGVDLGVDGIATISAGSNDMAGEIVLTTGSSGIAGSGTFATVTYASGYGTAPWVTLTPSGTNAWYWQMDPAIGFAVYATNFSSTTFDIHVEQIIVTGTAPTNSQIRYIYKVN